MCAQDMILSLDSIFKIIGRDLYDCNEEENLHLDNDQDIHMSIEIYEEAGYGLDLDLLTMLYSSLLSYPRRSRLFRRSKH